jgi:hypothetical protein
MMWGRLGGRVQPQIELRWIAHYLRHVASGKSLLSHPGWTALGVIIAAITCVVGALIPWITLLLEHHQREVIVSECDRITFDPERQGRLPPNMKFSVDGIAPERIVLLRYQISNRSPTPILRGHRVSP